MEEQEIYRRIMIARERMGMSQDELAKKVGYKSRAAISKIEKGKVHLSQQKLDLLAKALNVSPAWLLGFSDEENRHFYLGKRPVFEELIELANMSTDEEVEATLIYLKFLHNQRKEL